METGSFWPWICDTLGATEIGFHLGHASTLEAIAKARTHTHSVDARMLAGGLIPEVHPKPPAQREICRLLRHRRRPERARQRFGLPADGIDKKSRLY